MTYFLTIFIGISVNLDNFLIGIHLGLKRQKLTVTQNLIISSITGLCAGLSTLTISLISGKLLNYAGRTAGILMVVFGIYCLLAPDSGCTLLADCRPLSFPRAFLLGFVLSVNCIPPAFSAGLLRLPPLGIGFFCGLFSFLTMYSGNQSGLKMTNQKTPSFLGPASAVLLILIGAFEAVIQ